MRPRQSKPTESTLGQVVWPLARPSFNEAVCNQASESGKNGAQAGITVELQ